MAKLYGNSDNGLASDLAAIRQDLTKLTERISTLVQHQAEAAGSSVSATVDGAKETVNGLASDAQEGLRSATHSVEASIEQNPLTTALIVFGIGISLGMLSRSRV